MGLSPLARGNRPHGDSLDHLAGPIPARAGESGREESVSIASRAYPRSRGGIGAHAAVVAAGTGLSPLARGNHRYTKRKKRRAGPIPARAGES